MDLLSVDKFDWGYCVIALICTVIPFLWLLKRPTREKLYIVPFIFFFFIYSGIGVSWEGCVKDYLFYYFEWMVFFSLTLLIILANKKTYPPEGVDSVRTSFVTKHSLFFIWLYILLKLFALAQAGKIGNLISPPSLDIYAAITGDSDDDGVGVLYYLNHIIFIFYFVSLYKYRNKIWKLFFFIFFPFYIDFSSSGYVARSTVMAYLIIYYVAIYYYNPSLRKKLRLSVYIGLPFLLIGLSFYTFIRMGAEVDRTAGDAIVLLAYQETSYPVHYTLIKKIPESFELFKDYIQWLITLPLPGFLKDTSKDYFFNAIFTERVYGIMRGTQGFYVLLPGIVNEGLFIFGRWLLPIHAIIVGLFVGFAYRIIKYKGEFFLFLYVSIFVASLFARAGSVSTYPVYLKDILVYEVILFLYANYKKKSIRV